MRKKFRQELALLLIPVIALVAYALLSHGLRSIKPHMEVLDSRLVALNDGSPFRHRLRIEARYVPARLCDAWWPIKNNFHDMYVATTDLKIHDDKGHHYSVVAPEAYAMNDGAGVTLGFNLPLADIEKQMLPTAKAVTAHIKVTFSTGATAPLQVTIWKREKRQNVP